MARKEHYRWVFIRGGEIKSGHYDLAHAKINAASRRTEFYPRVKGDIIKDQLTGLYYDWDEDYREWR